MHGGGVIVDALTPAAQLGVHCSRLFTLASQVSDVVYCIEIIGALVIYGSITCCRICKW